MLRGLENDYWIAIRPIWDIVVFDESVEEYENGISAFSEVQVNLFAAHLMYCEVLEGGFHQFYFNDTGITIYEALEGFKATGMIDSAAVIQETIDYFEGKDLHDRDIRVRQFKYDITSKLDDKFKELIDTEKGGFHRAANSYLHEHMDQLNEKIQNQIKNGENKNRNAKKTNTINWDELYEKYSEKEGDEDFYSQKITDQNLSNLLEFFIGRNIIESAVDTYDNKAIGNSLATEFIRKIHSDYCVDYVFQKFSETEEPSTKKWLASLLGEISNPRILNYYDQLLTHKKFKREFGYILHNLINDKMVTPDDIAEQVEKLKDYHPKAYDGLVKKISELENSDS